MHFDDQNKQIVFISMSWNVLKEIQNTFSMFLWSYGNTCGSLGELEKVAETLACRLMSLLWWAKFNDMMLLQALF